MEYRNISGVARVLVRGNTLGDQPRGRVGRWSLPDLGEFSKILKKFLMKIAKMHILAYFSKWLTNHPLIFHSFGRKTQIVWKF